MNDVQDDLRELLRRRAATIPPQLEAPRSLTGRVRRRIAVSMFGVTLTVLMLVGTAVAGVRFLGAVPREDLGGSPPASHQPTSTPACTSGALRAAGSLEGAAGSREGGVNLTNFSDATCSLQGRPTITLLDENVNPITSDVEVLPAKPGWKVDGSPKPAGWPVVTIAPGDSALVRIRWSNWCPDGRPAPLWRLGIAGSGTVDVSNGFDELGPPPCNGPGLPSTIEVGPFEPGTGP
jgi:hypothetical protein